MTKRVSGTYVPSVSMTSAFEGLTVDLSGISRKTSDAKTRAEIQRVMHKCRNLRSEILREEVKLANEPVFARCDFLDDEPSADDVSTDQAGV